MIQDPIDKQPSLREIACRAMLGSDFPMSGCNRWVGIGSKFSVASKPFRRTSRLAMCLRPAVVDDAAGRYSGRERPVRRNNLCGSVRMNGCSTAKSLPGLRNPQERDGLMERPGEAPARGCGQSACPIPLSALHFVFVQSCMEQELIAPEILSKTNKPGLRYGIVCPSERQCYEKGNVNQLFAAGRMPDCDC